MWSFRRRRNPAPAQAPDRPAVDPRPDSGGTGGPAGGGPGSPAGGAGSAPAEISDEEILDRVATQVVRRQLAVPAILFLESSKPLSYVGSQFLVFMEPFVKSFFAAPLYDRFAALMEDREKYELLIRKIEEREAQATESRKSKRKADDHG